ncbi:hypothetical protein SAMN02910369_00045 [Lachnospiraceae bacterium NE2001]|nr:hypothetical protein SAMN02910369_00045 [Lachnospiraceae bacterium NE2001]
MRKKILTMSLALALCMAGLTACGQTEEATTEATTEAVTEATTEADNGSDDTTEASAGDSDSDDSAASVDGKKVETPLANVTYDDKIWTLDEENKTETDEKTSLKFQILDGDDIACQVEVYAGLTDCYQFRENLYDYGFDQKEYADGKVETTNIGGAECVMYETGSTRIFTGRDVGAGESFTVKASYDCDNENVQALIDGIEFKITDVGNTDYPWYWEGEPFSVDSASATVGDLSLTANQLKMDDPFVTHETFNQEIAVTDDKIYILENDYIRSYTLAETGLVFDSEYDLGAKYSSMNGTDDGRIFLSQNGRELIEWKDGEIVTTYADCKKDYDISPDGTWGVGYFVSGDECEIVTLNGDGTSSSTPASFAEIKTINHLNVSNDKIFVCGSPSDEDSEATHIVGVYNKDGSLDTILTISKDEENVGVGSVTFVADTANGYFAMDGNMRTMPYWSKDGTYQGRLEDSDLFGTNYPWFSASAYHNGSLYTVMTEKRADQSATEVICFQVNGF